MIVLLLLSTILIEVTTIRAAGDLIVEEETIVWGHGRNFPAPIIYDNGIMFINFTNLSEPL